MDFNAEKIETFKDLMDEVVYDWEFNKDNLRLSEDGVFHMNKTSIGKNFLEYKTECHELADGLYDKLYKLYEMLNE